MDSASRDPRHFFAYLHQLEEQLRGRTDSDPFYQDVLNKFSNTLEELHVAVEDLHQQNEELELTKIDLDRERRRYELLFEFAPEGYLVTDLDGKIKDLNWAAEILGTKPYLIGKPLLVFIDSRDRRGFLKLLAEQKTFCGDQEREFFFKPQKGETFLATVRVSTLGNAEAKPDSLVWLIREITKRHKTQVADRFEAEKQRQLNAYDRSLIEVSLDPLVTISPAGKITDVNTATEEATGFKREELIGTEFSEYFTEPQRAKEIYQQVLERGSVRDYELELRHRDGHITPVLYNASIYRDESGQVAGVFAAARDMTEHLRAEEQLRLQTTALESAANGVFITDKKGNIQWSNPAFNRMTGYSNEEVFGKNPRLWNSGKQDNAFYTHLWQTILAGKVWQGELVNRRKDGSEYYEEQTIAPVFNKNRAITHFVVVKQDITERKVAETLVRAESQRSQVLAEFSRGLSEAGTDYQAVIDRTTRQVAVLTGDICTMRRVAEEPLSLKLISFSSPDQVAISKDLRTTIDRFMEAIAARITESGETMTLPNLSNESPEYSQFPAVARLVDRYHITSVLVQPLRVQARVIGSISLFRCSTRSPWTQTEILLLQNLADRAALAINNAWLYADQKKSLETEQSLRTQIVQVEKFSAVGRMVASIAHEINNPLQTVKNCLYLARREIPEGEGHDYLDMASSEIQRISRLVAQLREIYRPRSSGYRQAVNLNQVLDDVSALIEPHLQRQNVTLARPLVEDQFIINGIADQLKQVFLNISLNAIEAMQPDGGTLSIQCQLSEDQSQVGIKFIDTGPGMTPEVMSKLFQPLFTTKEFGLGLGLSISNDIVQRHGGTISVQSQPSQGAEFIVWLPLSHTAPENSLIEEQ